MRKLVTQVEFNNKMYNFIVPNRSFADLKAHERYLVIDKLVNVTLTTLEDSSQAAHDHLRNIRSYIAHDSMHAGKFVRRLESRFDTAVKSC